MLSAVSVGQLWGAPESLFYAEGQRLELLQCS